MLKGLLVVEVLVIGSGDMLVVFVFGDGGWVGLDKDVVLLFNEYGVVVVGIDLLCYFWSECMLKGFVVDL